MSNQERSLNDRLAGLNPAQLKAMLQKGRDSSAPKSGKPEPMPRNRTGTYPLSKAQERMWFLNELCEGEAVYNNPAALRIRGEFPLNIQTLGKSLEMVIARHEILRTTFHLEGGLPVQQVHHKGKASIIYLDLRDLPKSGREKRAMEEAMAHGKMSIPLDNLPLLRFCVLHLDDLEYMLLINPHHIISDGWSNALFAKELSMTYAALESGETPPFPVPEYQYIDFVKWEQEWMRSSACEEQMKYWKGQLTNLPDPLKLPFDFPRPAVMNYRGAKVFLEISPDDTEQYRAFCQKHNLTLFHLLFGTFSLLMAKYSGNNDIMVGMPVARRNQLCFHNTMGLFINTLPLRVSVDTGISVTSYLEYIKKHTQQAMLRQELPFEKLILEVNPDRNLSTNPVFQVHFVHQNIPSLYSVKGLEVKPESIDYSFSKFDLNFWIEETNRGLVLSATYPADLFLPSTMSRLLRNYRILLENIVSARSETCGGLVFFPDSEIAESIGTRRDFGSGGFNPWLDTFLAQAGQHPENIAVKDTYGSMSYAELNRQSDLLADKLFAAGVLRGDRIGILLPRNGQMIVSILAVFKCGAAYAPLDQSFPAERLKFITSDAALKGTITTDGFVFREENGPPVQNSQDFAPAYVIYTSGTTGLPKGVCIGSRQLFNYSMAVWERMKLNAGDSCATISSIAADLGNTCIFPPLLHGATIVVVPEECITDATMLARWLAKSPADCLKIVPSHLMSLLSSSKASDILPKKLLITGGEKCTRNLVKRVRELSPELRILNHYGPTEATVGSLTWELPPGPDPIPPPGSDSYPIGFPLDNTRIYLKGIASQLLPKGLEGEILLSGDQIADDYLNCPELTKEKFTGDPLYPGEKIYHTGDVGNMADDGSVLFLGRRDGQVKVRGYRVEIGEIEKTLLSLPEIGQAVVVMPADASQVDSLKCAIVMTNGKPFDEPALRRRLSQLLPAYMIPSSFTVLESMPLTANGKTDIQKLRSRCLGGDPERKFTVAPRDITELRLFQLFAQILGNTSFGVSDSFFDLGGHSLLAIQLFSGIETEFGIHLPLSVLFQNSTVKALSNLIRENIPPASQGALVPIRPGSTGKKLFLVHPAGGNVLCYFELGRELPGTIGVFGLQSAGLSGKKVDSVSDMARVYLEELGNVAKPEDIVFGGWSMGALIAFEMARQLKDSSGKSPGLVIIDQLAPEQSRSDESKKMIDPVDRMVAFAAKVAHLVGKPLGISESDLRQKDGEGRSSVFLAVFKEVNLVPEEMKLSDFHGYLDTMIHHNEITSVCSPGSYSGPALLIRASEALKIVGQDEVERSHDLGWEKYIPSGLEIQQIPGNHVSVMTQPWVKALSEAIAQWMNRNTGHPDFPIQP